MAIYESAASRESSPPASMLLKVMDFVLCGPVLRMLQGTTPTTTKTTTDPYARMMMVRNNNNDDHRHNKASATTISVRMISFWVCFAAVALAYSKRNISVDVWRSILKRPTRSPRSSSSNNRRNNNNDESFQETVEAVYALCRRLIRYAVDVVLETSKQQRRERGQRGAHDAEPHDLSPAQHRGSCHCGAVQFVVFGPKTLYVESTTSSTTASTTTTTTTTTMNNAQYNRRIVSYEYARIDTTSLTWDEGNVQAYDARFFFCPRCGVHLAHAEADTTSHHPRAQEDVRLYINVNCLDGDSYILRPISSRPPEEAAHSLLRRPNMDDVIPLTVPVPVIATADHHQHHYAMVSDGGSTTMASSKRQQPQQQQYRCAPSSPSVFSALEDDLELMSTTMDNRSIALGTAASVANSSARTTTEDLAVTAYRLRKALSSHTTSTTTSTTTAKTSSPVSSSLSPPRAAVATAPPPTASAAGSETKGDDDEEEEDEDISNTPDESSSPATTPQESLTKASVLTYRAAETDGSSSFMTSDAEQLRRYLAKHG